MKRFAIILAVVGVILAVSIAAQATVVTLTFDPNDLIDLYPATPGDVNDTSTYKAVQPNARRLHGVWATSWYETFYNPVAPHTQPNDYNTYMNWRAGLGKNEGIATFNSWFLNNPAAVSWGETVVSKPGSTFSATTASDWNVRYIDNPYNLGGTSAQWWTTDPAKRIRPGGADIGEFSITADLYWDQTANGWTPDDVPVQAGDEIRFWLGNLNGDDPPFYRDDTQAIYFDDTEWDMSTPNAGGPFAATYASGANTPLGSGFEAAMTATAVIPEPASIIIWSLIGGLGVTLAWWRRRKSA